ncbi:hypothetical protein AB0L49_43850 [Streptomyces antimycoticus]|nr:hypothetical protein [Streptomyces antimycoticus]
MGQRDVIALIDRVHQLVEAPIVLARDRLNNHVFRAIRKLIVERPWLTVFRPPFAAAGCIPGCVCRDLGAVDGQPFPQVDREEERLVAADPAEALRHKVIQQFQQCGLQNATGSVLDRVSHSRGR